MSSICITTYKGIEISIDPETGMFSALIKDTTVQKETLSGIKAVIDSKPVCAVRISLDSNIAEIVLIRTDRTYADRWPIDAVEDRAHEPEQLYELDERSRAAIIMVKQRKELSERLYNQMVKMTPLTMSITEAK